MASSYRTFDYFIKKCFEEIFRDVNQTTFKAAHVDLPHSYTDGMKLEANANRY